MMNDAVFLIFSIAAGVLTFMAIYRFVTLNHDEQVEKLREWLLWAVVLAEREYGQNMGKVKLREVYSKFVEAWPQIASWMSFSMFSQLVDDALRQMKSMLTTNQELYKYVKGYSNEEV